MEYSREYSREYHLCNNEELINELVALRKRNEELEILLDMVSNSSPLELRDSEGKPCALVGISRDITRHKETEEALERSEAKYRTLFNSMDEGFFICDVIFDDHGKPVDWRYLEVNPAYAKQRGFTDPVGKLVSELTTESEEFWFEFYGKVAKTGVPARCINEYYPLKAWFELYAFKIGGEESNRIGVTFKDITERKKAELANQELMDQLRQSDQNKGHFLSVLSHELRNPLAAIMMGIELQKQVEPGSIQDKQTREIMERQGKHLTRLVDDLLDITRISENKLNLKKERFEVNDLIQQVAEDHRRQFMEKGVGLALELGSQQLPIEADQARIVQVFGNLLHNALKFTKEKDKVTLAAAGDPITKEAVIHIKDTGSGIPPELLPKLFMPFVQEDNTLARSKGGLGLGLAIAKEIVQLHGGTITIESEGIGKGTLFVIRLPLILHVDNHDDQAAEVSSPSQTLRILIIDDIPDLADILATLLEFLGHTTETAFSGTEGIAKAKASKPDVIICDIGLPDMSGYEVARSIRSHDDLRNIPMIALSGYAQDEDRDKAMAAGFIRHAAKPVDIDKLRQLLSEIIDKLLCRVA